MIRIDVPNCGGCHPVVGGTIDAAGNAYDSDNNDPAGIVWAKVVLHPCSAADHSNPWSSGPAPKSTIPNNNGDWAINGISANSGAKNCLIVWAVYPNKSGFERKICRFTDTTHPDCSGSSA